MKSFIAKKSISFLALALLALLASVPLVWGAEAKKSTEQEFPLHITSARLEADQNNRTILFSGQVKAEYGDSILYADQLRVYFEAKPASPAAPAQAPAAAPGPSKTEDLSPLADLGGEKIDHIVATGQVRFVQEDKVATGQEAIYYKNRDEVVLLGNPQLWRGENSLKGEKIVFNLKTNQMVAESSPQKRVEANLYPSGQKGAAATKPSIPGLKPAKPAKPRERRP